jgi:hypothetical protein
MQSHGRGPVSSIRVLRNSLSEKPRAEPPPNRRCRVFDGSSTPI